MGSQSTPPTVIMNKISTTIIMIIIIIFLHSSNSAPNTCKCSNPYPGRTDPDFMCSFGTCFVQCGSGCNDEVSETLGFWAGRCRSAKACALPGGKEDLKVEMNCKNSVCKQTNVINLKISNTQNCYGSNCVMKNQG